MKSFLSVHLQILSIFAMTFFRYYSSPNLVNSIMTFFLTIYHQFWSIFTVPFVLTTHPQNLIDFRHEIRSYYSTLNLLGFFHDISTYFSSPNLVDFHHDIVPYHSSPNLINFHHTICSHYLSPNLINFHHAFCSYYPSPDLINFYHDNFLYYYFITKLDRFLSWHFWLLFVTKFDQFSPPIRHDIWSVFITTVFLTIYDRIWCFTMTVVLSSITKFDRFLPWYFFSFLSIDQIWWGIVRQILWWYLFLLPFEQ